MKTKIFSILAMLLITSTFAQQKLIAVKGAVTDAITTNLTDAIALAQPGDKIYLPGGFFQHTEAIEKQVHIIGTGFQDGQNVMGRTTINGNLTLGDLADNSTFEGFYLSNDFVPSGILDNITFKRCNMSGTTNVNGARFDNSNFINCVVRETLHFAQTGYPQGQSNIITNSFIKRIYRAQYTTIKNCIVSLYLEECDNMIVRNNIFDYTDPSCNLFLSSSNMILENNMIKLICNIASLPGVLSNSNTIPYNVIAEVFMNATVFSFNSTSDFNLVSTSIGNNAGTDGTDIGIYGGSNPWKDGSLPIIPNIEQNNSYLDVPTGQFKLNVKVVPQTH